MDSIRGLMLIGLAARVLALLALLYTNRAKQV
eukprot:COSAG01_NODE_3852_length_5629_cov_3.080108_13_plen_32_part_00